MPICIHCATPIESLYMRYGQDHIVLAPCTSAICAPTTTTSSEKASAAAAVVLADEYLTHDLPIVIVDLMLAKPQAYRHLLFNRPSIFAGAAPSSAAAGAKDSGGGGGWREVWEVGKRVLALALVDAYIRWFYLCVQPPSLLEAGGEGEGEMRGRLFERAAAVVQRQLPVHAGMFFPSLFTPRSTPAADAAIAAVCSATPLWSYAANADADAVLATLTSYANVLLITLAETLALHTTVSLLTHLTTRWISPERRSPLIASKALLLSQLSPLLLLTFVLLWSSKFPRSHSPTQEQAQSGTSGRGYMVWIIRTFLASLNAGVALATVLPKGGGGRVRRVAPALILAAGWSVQAGASAALYGWLS